MSTPIEQSQGEVSVSTSELSTSGYKPRLLREIRDEAKQEAMGLLHSLGAEYNVLPEPDWRKVERYAERLAKLAKKAQMPTTVGAILARW